MADEAVIRIDTSQVPNFRKEELARGALLLVEQVFSLPGAEERFQEWKSQREKHRRKTAEERSS